jgi:hypothetical protein
VVPPTAKLDCLSIAADYAAVVSDASLCDPVVADPCGAQRPIPVYEAPTVGPATLEGLCRIDGGGFVNPTRTARLDEILTRYEGAGCQIFFCPGPPPHTPHCTDNGSGTFTCG